MKKRTKYYIAYGSNLNVNQMAWRCPGAEVAGIATLKDWRLLFKGSKTGSYLTIEHCPGAEVPVGIWKITEADERSLDRYEGYPHFYYKLTLPITMDNILTAEQKEIEALVYVMHEERPLGIPSMDYLRTCGRGYLDFGFDTDPLEDALRYSEVMIAKASGKEVI